MHGKRPRHSASGQGGVELIGVMICLVPVALILLDCAIVAIGAGLNDAVCADAARAMASGRPSSLTLAEQRPVLPGMAPHNRALAVLKKVYGTKIPAKIRETFEASESVRDVPPEVIGGAIDGEVSIKTTIDVYPPFVLGFVVGNQGVSLSSRHALPITYVEPAKEGLP